MVDPVTRLPIGRPTLTLAIDVNTRIVMGFYLSLEAPSLTAVALCLTHAVMDKTAWLASRGIAADWPAHGIPRTIHVDNGAEFHARAFERACGEHRIDLTYRPPGTLRWLVGRDRSGLTVKYDPRDLSCVFVAAGQGYLEARPADRTRPAIALWEHRAAVRTLREQGRRAVDEGLIFSTILAQRALIDEATRTTKAMRRDAARRAHLASTKMIDVTAEAGPLGDDEPLQLPYFVVEEWDD